MADKLLIIHGYSDNDSSFANIRDVLAQAGLYTYQNIDAIEYASLDDQSTFYDFADKLEDIYQSKYKGERIDVLAHSTGSLIARSWLYFRRKYKGQQDVPIEHLFLFSPANFGSDLAYLGQSFLAKFQITFTKKLNPFTHSNSGDKDLWETGKQILQGLEPASPFQWELSNGDLHQYTYFGGETDPEKTCFPFVFAAGSYKKSMEARIIKAMQKPGTDGTVRICGTSLNTRKCTLRSNHQNQNSLVIPEWTPEHKFTNIAFTVFPEYEHCSIINEAVNDAQQWRPLELLIKAKAINSIQGYHDLANNFTPSIDQNHQNATNSVQMTNKYQQFFFKVNDDAGFAVKDFYIDLYIRDKNTQNNDLDLDLTNKFDKKFSDFYCHSLDSSYRVLMINCDEMKNFCRTELAGKDKQIVLKIMAKHPTNNVFYDDEISFIVYDGNPSSVNNNPNFFASNTTTLVEIILNRQQTDKLMKLGDFQ